MARGTIVKKAEGVYMVRVFLGRDDKGKQKFFNKTVRGTKKDADGVLTRILRERDLGTWAVPSKESTWTYLDRWLRDCARPRMKPSTFDMATDHLKRYVKPDLGHIPIEKLSPIDVQACYTRLTDRGLSPGTVRRVHAILGSALNQAVRWGLIPRNPAGTKLVTLPPKPKQDMKTMGPEDVARFREAAMGDKHWPLWAFMLTTGVRPGEALALKWSDLDIDLGTATIQRSLTWRTGGGFEFTTTKTDRIRVLPIPASLITVLKLHRVAQAKERLAVGPAWQNHDLVFASEEGTPHRRNNLNRRHFRPVLKAAGLPEDLRLYGLRHSCATILLAQGHGIKVVAERLGHANASMTLNVYAHALPSQQVEASQAMGALLFGGA